MATLQIHNVLIPQLDHHEVPDLPLDMPDSVTTFE